MRSIDVPGVGPIQFPDSMSDEQIIQAIERDILPGVRGRTQVAPVQQTEAPAQRAPAPERGFLGSIASAVGDTGASLVTGAGSALSGIGGLGGVAGLGYDNLLSRAGRRVSEFGEGLMSPELVEKRQALSRAIQDAESQGLVGEARAALSTLASNPSLLFSMAIEQIPAFVLSGGVGRGASAIGQVAARRAAVGGGEAAEQAILQAGQRAGQAAAIGTAAGLQGGGVAEQTYQDVMRLPGETLQQSPVYQELLRSMSPEEARATVAERAAREAGLLGGGISVATMSVMPSAEKALFSRGVSQSAIRRALGIGAGEASSEAIEEGGGQFAQNLAIQRRADAERSLTQGVGGAAATGAVLGGIMGAGVGAIQRPPVPPSMEPGAGNLPPELRGAIEDYVANREPGTEGQNLLPRELPVVDTPVGNLTVSQAIRYFERRFPELASVDDVQEKIRIGLSLIAPEQEARAAGRQEEEVSRYRQGIASSPETAEAFRLAELQRQAGRDVSEVGARVPLERETPYAGGRRAEAERAFEQREIQERLGRRPVSEQEMLRDLTRAEEQIQAYGKARDEAAKRLKKIEKAKVVDTPAREAVQAEIELLDQLIAAREAERRSITNALPETQRDITARENLREQAGEAFDIAEARRQRLEEQRQAPGLEIPSGSRVPDTIPQQIDDTRAGAPMLTEMRYVLNPEYEGGRLVGGENVVDIGEADEFGNVLARVERQRGNIREIVPVETTMDKLVQIPIRESARMTQEARAAGVAPPRGVGSDIQPRRAVDRQTPEASARATEAAQAEAEAAPTASEADVRAERRIAALNRINALYLDKLKGMGVQGRLIRNALVDALKNRTMSAEEVYAAFTAADRFADLLPAGANHRIEFVKELLPTKELAESIARSGGNPNQTLQGLRLRPKDEGLLGVIKISLAPDALPILGETAAHEAFHVLQDYYGKHDAQFKKLMDQGFRDGMKIVDLDPTIRRKLEQARYPNSTKSYWDVLTEAVKGPMTAREAQAYAFGALVDASRRGVPMSGLKPAFARFVNTIKNFFSKLGSALRGDGFQTAEELLGRVAREGGRRFAGMATPTARDVVSRGPELSARAALPVPAISSIPALYDPEVVAATDGLKRVRSIIKARDAEAKVAKKEGREAASAEGASAKQLKQQQAEFERRIEDAIKRVYGIDEYPEGLDGTATLIQNASRDALGQPIYASSPETDKILSQTLAAEVIEALVHTEAAGKKNAKDWYTQNIRNAMAIASLLHPELTNDEAARAEGFQSSAEARVVFTAAMAITSQDMDVKENAKAAEAQYRAFKNRREFDFKQAYGSKADAISNNLKLFNTILRGRFGGDLTNMGEFLNQKFVVRDLAQAMNQWGVTISGELMDQEVYGSMIFGPKIGNGFYQNLNANFDPVTIDKWLMRTWGRITGNLIGNPELGPEQAARLMRGMNNAIDATFMRPEDFRLINAEIKRVEAIARRPQTKKSDRLTEAETAYLSSMWDLFAGEGSFDGSKAQQSALLEAMRDFEIARSRPLPFGAARQFTFSPDMSDEQQARELDRMTKFANDIVRWWNRTYLSERRAGKSNAEVLATQPLFVLAAKSIVTQQSKPKDNPGGGEFRRWVRSVIADTQNILRDNGYDMTAADIQAVLWYPEKYLWKALGTRLEKELDVSYEEAFREIARARGKTEEAIGAVLRSVERDGRRRDEAAGRGAEQAVARADVGRGDVAARPVAEFAPEEAPPGLTEEQFEASARATNTTVPEFKNWWNGGWRGEGVQVGPSVAVKTDGSPVDFYHGTQRGFTRFGEARSGSYGQEGPYFFSPNPRFAEDYALNAMYAGADDREVTSGQRMLPVYLSVQNPFDSTDPARKQELLDYIDKGLDDETVSWRDIVNDSTRERYEDYIRDGRYSENEIIRRSFRNFREILMSDVQNWAAVEMRAAQRYIREQGYDGFFLVEDGQKNIAVYDPRQIKSVFNRFEAGAALEPEFSARRTSLASDPSFAAIRDKLTGKEYDKPNVFADGLRRFTGALPGEKISSALVRTAVNRAAPGWMLDRLAKEKGLSMRSVGLALEVALNNSGRIQMYLDHGPLAYDPKTGDVTVREDAPGLIAAIKGRLRVEDKKEAQAYLVALRERDLRKAGKKGFFNLTDAEIREIISKSEATHPEWKEMAADIQRINKALLDFAVATGTLDRSKADQLASMFYTPFYRQAEEDGKLDADAVVGPRFSDSLTSVKTAFDVSLKGGVNPLGDLFENMIRNADAIMKAGMKNVAMRQAAEVTEAVGLGRPAKKREPGKTITYRVNGQDKHFEVDDPVLYTALAGAPREFSGGIYETMANIAGFFRDMITIAPSFMLANLWRGKVMAYVQEGVPFYTNTFDGLRQALKSSSSYKAIAAQTGFGGYTYGMGERDATEALEREIAGVGYGPKGLLRRSFDALQKASEATEMAERIKLYERAKAQGMTDKEAAFQAYLLAPFSRRGMGGGWIGSTVNWLVPLVPFLNAKIQGMYRLIENEKGDTQKLWTLGIPKQMFLRGLVVMGASLALAAKNMADEPERWDEENPDLKFRYDILYLPGGNRILLPRAFEVGSVFGALPVFIVDAIRREDSRDLGKVLTDLGTSTFFFNPIPQAAVPLLGAFTNYDFFRGRALETAGDQSKLPEERVNRSTSTVARLIGETMGVSPIRVQYVLEGYSGTIGTSVLAGFDSILAGIGAIPGKPAGAFGDPLSMPAIIAGLTGASRFYRSDDQTASRFVGDFYKIKEMTDQLVRSQNMAMETRNLERLAELRGEAGLPLRLRPMVNQASTQINEINKRMARIERSDMDSVSKADALRPLREQRDRVARRVVERARQMGAY